MEKIELSVFVLAIFATLVLAIPTAAQEIKFIPPTPENNTEVTVSYVNVTVNVTAPNGVSTVILNWNGKNKTMPAVGENIYSTKNINLLNGEYTYGVYANDTLDNWEVSETRVVIVSIMCGDVTCDGMVDVSDVGRLLYYVGFPGDPGYTICSEWAADVTCDGAIDVSDVGRLLYHVGFPGDPNYTLKCC
jgi:hypothetical protein